MVDSTSTNQRAAEWQLIAGDDVSSDFSHNLALVQNGDFKELLDSALTQKTLGADINDAENASVKKLQNDLDYAAFIEEKITSEFSAVADAEKSQWLLNLMCIGVTALRLYLQCTVTGPPPLYNPDKLLVPECIAGNADLLKAISKAANASLTVDGESAYHLAPHSIVLVLAKTILNSQLLAAEGAPETATFWRLRLNFLHQRILSERTGTLHKLITKDINAIASKISEQSRTVQAMFLVERGMVDTYFGNDVAALKVLEEAAFKTGLKYALTGVMGKRTKFQIKETSQLVVLAKSAEDAQETSKPQTLDLDDDTLLESISFSKKQPHSTDIKDESDIPAELAGLAELDANDQPPLHPLDATILLLITETIKNTNPEDGITREQMIPYAERVLSKSTNWEVYTLGLLVKSRIESTKARTVQRAVLQFQVIVDQIVGELTGDYLEDGKHDASVIPTFLPQPKEGESASVRERLLYIHQLPIPTSWELQAELAAKWTSVGALRSALEIYERLEMWADCALCYAATDDEAKAKKVIMNQLFTEAGEERIPPPPEAPRLWCILGDIEENPEHYEKAWTVSNNKYAKAKRFLGRYWLGKDEVQKSADAYSEALKIYPLHGPSWYALGCCWLELSAWEGAVRAFGRAVHIDDTDAETWSMLATALLRRGNAPSDQPQAQLRLDDEEEDAEFVAAPEDPKKAQKDALVAFKRAAQLNRDSWRIWDNCLTVAFDLEEWQDVVACMKQVINLLKDTKGELAVDHKILESLVQHIITEDLSKDTPTGYDPNTPGIQKYVVELVEKDVVPLITTNQRLWKIVAKLNMWRRKYRAALDAHEKAWRAVNSRPGILDATEKEWEEVVDATIELVDAYESLGPMERTDGLGAGELVAKDWKFKSRSVVRGVIGKGKQNWEHTSGFERLKECMEGLKA
ncbi:hypothetical protein BZA77DRAFT_307549 [Pyronema omphalodes]|nr:hypothetical protein BZA77DRAFT_307549 [Pyronema omphalodes]